MSKQNDCEEVMLTVCFEDGFTRLCPLNETASYVSPSIENVNVGDLVCAKWTTEPCYWEGTISSIYLNKNKVMIRFSDGEKAVRNLFDIRLVNKTIFKK